MSTFMTEAGEGSKPGGDDGPAEGGRSYGQASSKRSQDEDHWSVVLKKLAPQGYQKSPPWQQEIIERVVKQMAARQKSGKASGSKDSSAELARTIDLSALGVSPEAAEAFRNEEQRVVKAMRDLPGPGVLKPGADADGASSKGGPEPTALEKLLLDRQNQIHYFIRAIQMEQLLEQDLEQDLKGVRDEVGAAVRDEEFGLEKAKTAENKLAKQLLIVKKRCDSLTVKACEIASENAGVRLNIDDLRKEKMTHREHVSRMRTKAEKMDADIAFLTHQAHAALDQREKVRGKFLMAQRDMTQEREQKLAVIAELVQRANALDEDWADRQASIADADEARRRSTYGSSRRRREAYESAEVRYGYLTAQSRGWESEFERLQQFTGMETKFSPGQSHIVDEITSRYAEKERANTSLLRYLNEQQSEISSLSEQHKDMQRKREDLLALLGTTPSGYGGGATPETLLASAAEEERRAADLEASLDEVCLHVGTAAKSLYRPEQLAGDDESVPKPISDGRCNINTLEKWLAALERTLFDMYNVCKAVASPDASAVALPAGVRPPMILLDWCTREKTSKVPKVTVPEIHDALCLQAAQQRRGGELEEEEDEGNEDSKKEADKNRSPFQRSKVNKAQERQRIIEWARKRQPGQGKLAPAQAAQVKAMTDSGASAIRPSASAPLIRPGRSAADAKGGGGSTAGSSCALPAIGEGQSMSARSAQGNKGSERKAAAERAAAYTAQHGASLPSAVSQPVLSPQQDMGTPGMPTVASAASMANTVAASSAASGGPKPKGGAVGRLRAAASRSVPGLSATSSAPKDLGTVIYLLGTQSNSMNARRFLESSERGGM